MGTTGSVDPRGDASDASTLTLPTAFYVAEPRKRRHDTARMTSWIRRPWAVALVLLLCTVALVIAWFGRRAYVVVAHGAGLDPAIPVAYRVAPSIQPELSEHSRLYGRRMLRVGERVHVAIGHGLANVIFIEGREGVIVVDTGESLEQGRVVLAELRKVTDKPIAAVILTHHHADHVLGTTAFVAEEDARSGRIPIIAHESLIRHYVDETGILAELQAVRAMHMYGGALGPADRDGSNTGIGPFLGRGESGFLAPTKTFGAALDETIAGVRLSMRWAPSEAESEIVVYLPDDRILLSSDVIQGHTFPNIYTIRGARYRDPMRWVRSIDHMRTWEADAMVLQHGPPVLGKKEVARVLTLYRDQIQFVHDQTIRRMNQGMTSEELAEAIRLPPSIAEERPWGRQFYGTVKHSVRNIYGGYVGWFQGDPVDLNPTPRRERARDDVRLMGGRERVLEAARGAFRAGKHQRTAELATLLLRVDIEDEEPRHLKAAAFRKLGYAQINASWRNYYLVSAMELDRQIPAEIYLHEAKKMLGPALCSLPAQDQVAFLPTRLRSEQTFDKNMRVALRYTDAQVTFLLHLRHGVLEVSEGSDSDVDLTLVVTRKAMGDWLAGDDPATLLGGAIAVEGSAQQAAEFVGYFERAFQHKPEVVVR